MVGSSHRLYSSRGRKRKTKTAAPGGRRAPETARAPETHRQDEDSKTREQTDSSWSRRQAAAHLGNALVHPGLALIPTAPSLGACLAVLVQPLLQGIQHCLWLSRGHLKGERTVLALPASPQVPTPVSPGLPGAAGMSEAITGCIRSTAGGVSEGAVGTWEACGRGFRSGESRAQV